MAVSICEPHAGVIRTEQVPIRWHPSLPVFAKEEFLSAVGDDYGWIGGIDSAGCLRCMLPYTIQRKGWVRMVRFRCETIALERPLDLGEEKSFLNSVVAHFRNAGADVIIPGTNNAIFRTYPDGAQVAPYGTYIIDLQPPEDVLWRNMRQQTRQNIRTAQRDGVCVREGVEFLDPAYDLIRETFRRSGLPFMRRAAFHRLAAGLGEHGKLVMADYRGVGQSYCLIAFSRACAYGMYAGNLEHQHQGCMKLIQWELIRLFRSLGVQRFDLFGARLNPEKGSKQEAINLMKKRLGATLSEGYMWKYPLRPLRALPYSLTVRVLRGGDIVDQERHKFRPPGLPPPPEARGVATDEASHATSVAP